MTPGDVVATGASALLTDSSFLLYITPAMFAANEPVGGYVVTPGPAGLYAAADEKSYAKVDLDNPDLPDTVTTAELPAPRKTEAELLAEGPR